MPPIVPAVRRLAEELAEREGYELVEILLIPGERKLSIRVIIHRPEGVSLEDCRRFSEDFSAVLDVENAVSGPFVLEVSSPGLTRPLKSAADFRRNVGREIEFSYLAGAATLEASGVVVEAREREFTVQGAEGLLTVPYDAVRHAKPRLDWRQIFRAGKQRTPPEGTK
jgi:ribosome maturation factor RimP